MKKILLFISFIFFAILCCGSRSLAAYSAPDGNNYERKYDFYNVAGYHMIVYCDKKLVASQESMYQGYYMLLYPFNSVNNSEYGLYHLSEVYNNWNPGYNFVYGSDRNGNLNFDICLTENDGIVQHNGYLYCTAQQLSDGGIELYETNALALAASLQGDIDFSNVVYDPMIPTPDYSIYYTDDTSTLPRFPAEIQINNASDNYFVQIQIENLLPSVVAIGNDYSYAVMRYYQYNK